MWIVWLADESHEMWRFFAMKNKKEIECRLLQILLGVQERFLLLAAGQILYKKNSYSKYFYLHMTIY